MSPRNGQQELSVPQRAVSTYSWRLLGQAAPEPIHDINAGKVKIGDEVWVKPGDARCTTQWGRGRVTAINSDNNVDVEGVPRHILDIRPVIELGGEESDEEKEAHEVQQRPRRERRAPAWMQDYNM